MSNNAFIRPEPEVQAKVQEREITLVRIIEAVREIRSSQSWSTLKTEIFDSLITSCERELRDEAKRDNPNTNKLNRIAGEIKWAERFADLTKYENTLMVELTQVRTRLNHDKI